METLSIRRLSRLAGLTAAITLLAAAPFFHEWIFQIFFPILAKCVINVAVLGYFWFSYRWLSKRSPALGAFAWIGAAIAALPTILCFLPWAHPIIPNSFIRQILLTFSGPLLFPIATIFEKSEFVTILLVSTVVTVNASVGALIGGLIAEFRLRSMPPN